MWLHFSDWKAVSAAFGRFDLDFPFRVRCRAFEQNARAASLHFAGGTGGLKRTRLRYRIRNSGPGDPWSVCERKRGFSWAAFFRLWRKRFMMAAVKIGGHNSSPFRPAWVNAVGGPAGISELRLPWNGAGRAASAALINNLEYTFDRGRDASYERI